MSQLLRLALHGAHLLSIIFICLDELGGIKTEITDEGTRNDKFVHLLDQANLSRKINLEYRVVLKRIHSEVQVREYLDLNSWSQYLELSLKESNASKPGSESESSKISVLVLNGSGKKVVTQFEHYKCQLRVLDSDGEQEQLSEQSAPEPATDRDKLIAAARVLVSAAKNSPYFARIPVNQSHETWIFGVSGLFTRAKYPGDSKARAPRQVSGEDRVKVKRSHSSHWELELTDSDTFVQYHFVASTSNHDGQSANYDLLSDISVEGSAYSELFNFNVVGFEFSDELAKKIFKLPIGFGCPANPLIETKGFVFESELPSGAMLEFDVVVDKHDGKNSSKPVVRTVRFASSEHPLNALSTLTMFQVLESQIKSIRDFHSRLNYLVRGGKSDRCEVNRLHILDFKHKQAIEPVDIDFNNGVILTLTEMLLSFIFDSETSEHNAMHCLDRSKSSPELDVEEYVFESSVPDSYGHMLVKFQGRQAVPKVKFIRYYERKRASVRQASGSGTEFGKLKLKRLTMVILDESHTTELAQIKFEFAGHTVQLLNLTNRAKIFDLSSCYNLDLDSMQMVVTYPLKQDILDPASLNSTSIIESFYQSSAVIRDLIQVESGAGDAAELNRFRAAANFLRIPIVEVSRYENGLLELDMLVLNAASPVHLFDQIDQSTFIGATMEETMLVYSAAKCANYCEQFKCKMFAYDAITLECKISPISIEYEPDEDVDDEDGLPSNSGEDEVRIALRKFSKVYYKPAKYDGIDLRGLDDEVTLAELHSYLDHSLNDPQITIRLETEEQRSESVILEERISKLVGSLPLSFGIPDSQDEVLQPEEAKRRIVSPSKIRFVRIPVTLDTSTQAQAISVARAFRSQATGFKYQLDLLDDRNHISSRALNADERTFISTNNSTYYTLRKISDVDLDICATLCYNLNEWEPTSSSEQICSSYSFCKNDRQCILAVRTDFGFTRSILDLVKEGDVAHQINSISELESERTDCIVAARNYLSNFEGPIRLSSLIVERDQESDLDLSYEWLVASRIESDKLLEDSRDDCAEKCTKYNKIGKKLCMAMDYCSTVLTTSLDAKGQNPKHETSCHLLLIDNLRHHRDVGTTSKVNRLRDRLTKMRSDETRNINERGAKSVCNRYLLSYLNEFAHIKQRQLSGELESIIDSLAPTRTDINLNNCALECKSRQTECLAFVYCSRYDPLSRKLIRSCSIFKGLRESTIGDGNLKPECPKHTEYSRDCHIYLKNEIKSIEDLVMRAKIIRENSEFKGFREAIICLILFCLLGGAGLFLYVRSHSNSSKNQGQESELSIRNVANYRKELDRIEAETNQS